ncbi:MAG: hypothetical protein NZL87_05510, partial [Thermomicrobium sp.]|nr:hypothetical protein [Thermomicrobium sp.]
EAFDERCRDAIVVAGMTVSSAALRRLSELGVAGVIVGGLPVRALEPFFGTALLPWLRSLPHDSVTGWPLPFGVVMLEGFGRIPIAEAVFSIFRERAGRWTTLLRGESVGIDRPVCFMSSRGQRGRPLEPVPLCDGGLVHLRIPARPGIGRLCRLPFLARSPEGFAFEAVLVERDDRIEVVPVELVDPLELPS